MLLGAVLFSVVLLLQVVALPVEFNATARAKQLVVEYGIISPQDREGVDRVVNAAALTYVAAAVSTLLTQLYFLLRAGLLGGRNMRVPSMRPDTTQFTVIDGASATARQRVRDG